MLKLKEIGISETSFKVYFSIPFFEGKNIITTCFNHKQINKQQALERMWRKGNPNMRLVGIQTGAATVENSMEFPQKSKNGTAF